MAMRRGTKLSRCCAPVGPPADAYSSLCRNSVSRRVQARVLRGGLAVWERRQVQLDERVTKLRLTARELAAILLERCSTRAGSPQLLSPDDECSDPLPYLLDSGRELNRCGSLGGDQAHHS